MPWINVNGDPPKPPTLEELGFVQVVRCKDCWKREYDNCPFYDSFDYKPADDWFCADGERKEGR